MVIVDIKGLYKAFHEVRVFQDFSFSVEQGGISVIAGTSGSGKSTLLNMIGLLDKPDKGVITMFGETNVKPFSKKAEKLLRDKIGYLFQNFALVDDETVEYNLSLAMGKKKKEEKQTLIQEALARVGLQGFEQKKIYKCSGGEQQRVAIARLLLKPCELVLADEPTGSLDHDNKQEVIRLLKELKEMGKTIIVVTHDEEVMAMADHLITIQKRA